MTELTELLNNLEFWHWWVLAAALVAVEVFAPSTVFLWPGVAAAVVGLVLLVADDIRWQVQVLLFAALSVISLAVWLGFVRSKLARPAESALNRRGVQYIGREFVLAQPIVERQGTLNIDDTTWQIAGDDQDAGKRVRVVSMDGPVLNVEAA